MQESIASLYPHLIISAASGLVFGVATSLSKSLISTIPVFVAGKNAVNRDYPHIIKTATFTGIITALLWMLTVYPLATTGEMSPNEIDKLMIFIGLWSIIMSPLIEIAFVLTPKLIRYAQRDR